jgi:hypothetical protein
VNAEGRAYPDHGEDQGDIGKILQVLSHALEKTLLILFIYI